MSSFQALADPNARFSVLDELGAGSYGRVFRAVDKTTGLTVAVKAMSLDEDEEGLTIDREAMEKEVTLMKALSSSEFIVSYHDAFFCPLLREVWISMELCEIGSALDLIRILQRSFCETVAVSLARDCTLGLAFLHRQKIVHRDMK